VTVRTSLVTLGALLPALIALLAGCAARVPSSVTPNVSGSVGMPHRGVLANGVALEAGPGWRFLRDDDRHHALPRFAQAIARAATKVREQRPGAVLTIGDLSAPHGGAIMPHLSHRSGRDADLLLYLTTLEGAPAASPGFVHVEADGLAHDPDGRRYYRFDVEREWLLVKALLEDDEARVQWVFVSDTVRAMLLAWARSRGESTETLYRAVTVMAQPRPGGVHDDHVHVRTACTDVELATGCDAFGPERPWLNAPVRTGTHDDDDAELALSLFAPLGAP
jgi:penicillin-insensitive murein endopeptidase